MGLRIGIDTGGTFTDLVSVDENTGLVFTSKRPSTPNKPVSALISVIKDLQKESKEEISILIHGTTVATNCLLERKGANVLYIGTEGFTDILFIQRINRKYNYNLQWVKPKPLVRRRNCLGIRERIDHNGKIIISLEEEETFKFVKQIEMFVKENDIEAIVISLINSYVNPEHELHIANLLKKYLPKIPISISHEVAPIWREYPRASTTLADAYVKPLVGKYIKSLKDGLYKEEIIKDFSIMKSNGGIMEADAAPKQPIHTLLSGLAGGLIGGKFFGKKCGYENLLTLDMGGTSADVGMIWNGEERYTNQFELDWGIPILTPTLDIHTIGAGGGSIGWLDKGGMLHTGPQSAGADPGPVCYGNGGNQPTVTDANLILGRLNPNFFLGGLISLNLKKAIESISSLAKQLNLSVYETADAIIEVANENMSDAVRLVSIQKGYDPRKFILVAFGGAGSLHAAAIAKKLGIPKVIIPTNPGLCSAFGLLMANLRVDKAWTKAFRSDKLDIKKLNKELKNLKNVAIKELKIQGYHGNPMQIVSVGMRYLGQSHEHLVNLPNNEIRQDTISLAIKKFEKIHEERYGYKLEGTSIEFVDFHVTVIGETNKPDLKILENRPAPEPKEHRSIFFPKIGFKRTPVYRRYELPANFSMQGPIVIEENDSTTLVHPDNNLEINKYGIMVISLE